MNQLIALRLSGWFSSMTCFYGFLLLALLPLAVPASMTLVQFISSGVLQLVALPLLAVAGARGDAENLRLVRETHDVLMAEVKRLHQRLGEEVA